jgi:hypothetical protein
MGHGQVRYQAYRKRRLIAKLVGRGEMTVHLIVGGNSCAIRFRLKRHNASGSAT